MMDYKSKYLKYKKKYLELKTKQKGGTRNEISDIVNNISELYNLIDKERYNADFTVFFTNNFTTDLSYIKSVGNFDLKTVILDTNVNSSLEVFRLFSSTLTNIIILNKNFSFIETMKLLPNNISVTCSSSLIPYIESNNNNTITINSSDLTFEQQHFNDICINLLWYGNKEKFINHLRQQTDKWINYEHVIFWTDIEEIKEDEIDFETHIEIRNVNTIHNEYLFENPEYGNTDYEYEFMPLYLRIDFTKNAILLDNYEKDYHPTPYSIFIDLDVEGNEVNGTVNDGFLDRYNCRDVLEEIGFAMNGGNGAGSKNYENSFIIFKRDDDVVYSVFREFQIFFKEMIINYAEYNKKIKRNQYDKFCEEIQQKMFISYSEIFKVILKLKYSFTEKENKYYTKNKDDNNIRLETNYLYYYLSYGNISFDVKFELQLNDELINLLTKYYIEINNDSETYEYYYSEYAPIIFIKAPTSRFLLEKKQCHK